MVTPAHRHPTSGGGRRTYAILAAAAVVVLAGGGTAVGLSLGHSGDRTAETLRSASRPPTTLPPEVPLEVRSVTTSSPSHRPATLVSVTYSEPPTAASPTPRVSPATAGYWQRAGRTETFHPTAGFTPDSNLTVTVPAGVTADEQGRTVRLGHPVTTTFTVGIGSVRRLQELLAELGYLPLQFAPAGSTTAGALAAESNRPARVSVLAAPGTFSWASPDVPASLAAEWSPGQANLITKGAVMAFEGDHGLAVDGVAGPAVWTALRTAVAARAVDPRPYSYIMVTKTLPETLSVWQGGRIVYTSLANTGAPGADTADGTFAVETHYVTAQMKGTNPNGTTYDDKNIPYVAYFNGGDAIHGYPRASYGFPQSNGCVELPIANAGAVFDSGEDWYGTLVTIS